MLLPKMKTMSSQSYLVLAVLVLCIFEFSESNIWYPNILVEETEIVVDAHANHSVFCQGQKPLVWITPNVEEEEFNKSSTTFETKEEKPINTNFKYGLRLYITNMTYKFVGFYYCHYENDDNEKDSLYIYVDDEDHLSVTGSSRTVTNIYVRRYDTAVIPCRPTSDSVKVNLEDGKGFVDIYDVPPYNPYYGFSINATYGINFRLYVCNFTRNGLSERTIYSFIIESRKDFIVKPWIKDLREGHTMVGGLLNLKCGLESDVSVDFTWDVPNKNVNKHQIKITTNESKRNKSKSSILKISNVTSADGGVYTCHVFDHQNHTESSSLSLRVFGDGEHELFIEADSNFTRTYAGKNLIVWTVSVWGQPEPDYKWVTNQNTEIFPDRKGFDGTNAKYSFSLNKHSNVSRFTIRNISINDFGTYRLIASNKYVYKTVEFQLNVTGHEEHEIFIEADSNFTKTHAGTNFIEWTVSVWGNPEPDYKWVTNQNTEILPDREGFDGTNAKYSVLLDKNSKELKFTIRNITINDFGTYKLIASNIYLNKTLEFRLNVTDRPHVTIDLDKQFHKPGEPGTVYCTVKGFPPPEIKWEYYSCWSGNCRYREIPGTLIESEGPTLKSQVIITTKDQADILKCNATNYYGSDFDIQEFFISEYDNGFEITDFDDTVVVDKNDGSATFATGESIGILCGASKFKCHELTWFLGDVELKSNDRITIRNSLINFDRTAYLLIQNATSSDNGIYKCRAKRREESWTKEIKVFVKDPVKIPISDTKTGKIETNFPKEEISNQSSGIPRPEIMRDKDHNESPDGTKNFNIDIDVYIIQNNTNIYSLVNN